MPVLLIFIICFAISIFIGRFLLRYLRTSATNFILLGIHLTIIGGVIILADSDINYRILGGIFIILGFVFDVMACLKKVDDNSK